MPALAIAGEAEPPQKIGSTSLCGDSYVRALLSDGTPGKIHALSWQSRDPLSLASSTEQALPQIWNDGETIIASGVDMVILGPEFVGELDHMLYAAGINRAQIGWGEDFETLYTNIEILGEKLQVQDQAQHLKASLKSRLDALPLPAEKYNILYLAPAGFSAGPGTYIDAMITAAGGENLNTHPGWNKLDPEHLLILQPDLIVTGFADDSYASINNLTKRHHAYAAFLNRSPRLDIAGALLPCVGPDLVIATEQLNARLQEF